MGKAGEDVPLSNLWLYINIYKKYMKVFKSNN